MAYDETLAERIREELSGRTDVVEKKMFGGLCFMVAEHMCCGITDNLLMARVGPDLYEACLADRYAMEMDFTGKALKGMVYVKPAGIRTREQLIRWLTFCTGFVGSLPPKTK
jgi:TfoX/Sxy family transcriptional regulator of competence genes